MNKKANFTAGVRDGIPIFLGYMAVSFTFGIMGRNAGISAWEAVLISATNVIIPQEHQVLPCAVCQPSFQQNLYQPL